MTNPRVTALTMLDLHQLQDQFPDFSAYQVQAQRRQAAQLAAAAEAMAACNPHWEALAEQAESARLGLVARLREAPAAQHGAAPRPTPLTMVATDGSQIYPDRHVEPTCYLLNVSRIAFQYGTLEKPLIEAVPAFRYRQDDLTDLFDDLLEQTTAEVVSALRDEYELDALLATAQEVRIPNRPLLAVADGTLIRWMIRRMQNRALEERLIARYTHILDGFRDAQIPLCSYISMPGNTEVINLLRVHNGETETTPPDDPASLAGLKDRQLFEVLLKPALRSALFESASHIQKAYGDNRICYFYVRVPGRTGDEVGRVEVPAWVANDPALVDLVHAAILSECEKGEGYPMILSEAHERAVIRAHERSLFYELLEREMTGAGLAYVGSQKAASKRRPLV